MWGPKFAATAPRQVQERLQTTTEQSLTPELKKRTHGPNLTGDPQQNDNQQNSATDPHHRLRELKLHANPVQAVSYDAEDYQRNQQANELFHT